MRKALLVLLLAFLWAHHAQAQPTCVRGRITDAASGEALPFVSVYFPGTTTGITTDDEGVYALETRDTASRIEASYIGYTTQRHALRRNEFNRIDMALQPVAFGIDEVVVTPGENPAHAILAGVRRNRKRNDPDELERYTCRTYTKSQLDLTNIKPRFRNKRLQRSFGFIFAYADTSALTGQTALPAMIAEASADFYHSRRPAFTREVIRASRMSGIEHTAAIARFTGHLHGDVNFYDNFLDLFGVQFASPLAEGGSTYYAYFLVDSMLVDGRKTYKIRFHPRRLTTPVLDGEINIDSASYALQSATARMPKGVNVNWIRRIQLENVNCPTDSARWFRSRDRLQVEFSLTGADSSKLTSFLATREVTYTDVRIGAPIPAEVMNMDNRTGVDEALVARHDEAYWEKVRPYRLSEREKGIYAMVDSVKRVPLYRNIYTFINTFVTGYYNTKYIGIGPYFKLASFNRLEGFRMQLGARTTTRVSRRFRLTGYGAYGTRDGRFKGGGSAEFVFGRRLTRKFTVAGRHDVIQLGAGQNALTESNILSSIFSRGDSRLTILDRGEAAYDHEWREGLENRLGVRFQRIAANRYVPMLRPDGSPVRSVKDAAVQVGMRLSKDESIYRTPFDKRYMSTAYPVLSLGFAAGVPSLLPGAWEYYRIEGSLQYRAELPPLGYSRITLRGGKIFGRVPYPLLKLHEGNGTYFYDPYSFSCMNYYEFASDAWAGWFIEHHFNGWLLGRIPGLKKLRLREVLIFKGVWGTLSADNDGSRPFTRAPLLFPPGMTSVEDPYMELGFGVENIFRLLRIDFIWRLTHRHPVAGERIDDFAINFGMKFNF